MNRFRITSLCCLVSVASVASAQQPVTQAATPPAATAEPASFGEAMQLARRASQAGDREAVRRALRAARRFAPDDPAVLYSRARTESRLGDTTRAFEALERLALQGAGRDVAADSAFAAIRDTPRFRAAAAAITAAAAPVTRSDSAFTLGDPDFVPEGIAYDPSGDAFYVGSLHRRSVLRVRRDGARTTFLAPGANGLGQVLGLRVDPTRRRLWLATLVQDSTAPRFRSGIGGWAFLPPYELPSGRLVGRWAAPDSSTPHLLNDVAVAASGDVYVTDSEGDALWRLRAGARRLERVHGGVPGFAYPNGLALTPDGARLHVAHYEGLSVVELHGPRAGRVTLLAAPPGVPTGAVDGMYRCGAGLLAVQQRLDFAQITRFDLSADGSRVTGARTLERRHPAVRIPTTGAIAGDAFYYLADAQLDRLPANGGIEPAAEPRDPVVLRLPLGGACRG